MTLLGWLIAVGGLVGVVALWNGEAGEWRSRAPRLTGANRGAARTNVWPCVSV